MTSDFAPEVAFRECVSLLFHSIIDAACFILSCILSFISWEFHLS